jgi:peptide/nickel transport system substrate-binding protein
VQRGRLEDRPVHDALVDQALDLVELGLAALAVALARLLLEEIVDVGVPAVGVRRGADDEGLEARGGVALGGRGIDDEAGELLRAPRFEKRDPKLRLASMIPSATWWVEFLDQWKPNSPWHDRRVRLAANLAMDKAGINDAERLGYSRLTGSIVPSVMEFALKIEPYAYDPAHAKRLLAEAGYPNGFDAGDLSPLPPFTTMGEAVANNLAAVGIKTRVRSMERAAFLEAWRAKKLTGLVVNASAAQGNAASRLEAFVVGTSPYAYGGYPDIDDLFQQQAGERDRKRREAQLYQIQRLIHERVMHGPIFEPATLHGVGPRVEEAAIGLNSLLYIAAPYEEMRLKKP